MKNSYLRDTGKLNGSTHVSNLPDVILEKQDYLYCDPDKNREKEELGIPEGGLIQGFVGMAKLFSLQIFKVVLQLSGNFSITENMGKIRWKIEVAVNVKTWRFAFFRSLGKVHRSHADTIVTAAQTGGAKGFTHEEPCLQLSPEDTGEPGKGMGFKVLAKAG